MSRRPESKLKRGNNSFITAIKPRDFVLLLTKSKLVHIIKINIFRTKCTSLIIKKKVSLYFWLLTMFCKAEVCRIKSEQTSALQLLYYYYHYYKFMIQSPNQIYFSHFGREKEQGCRPWCI